MSVAFFMALSIFSFGMLSFLASAISARSLGFPTTSGPPCFTAMVISFPIFVKVRAMWPHLFIFLSFLNSNALPIA